MTVAGVSGTSPPTGRELENHLGGSEADRYRRYQLDLIAPYCGRSLLEVGAGYGAFAAQLAGLERLVLSDTDPRCLAGLRERFADRPEVEVVELDLAGPLTLERPVETVLALNVLEHIDDDVTALRRLAGLLAPDGRIVLWVPAYPALYGDFDRLVGHVRRYTPATMGAAARAAGLEVQRCEPVNLLGGLAWWAAVRLGRAGTASPRLVALYDRTVVPATRALERVVRPPFGQSVLFVGRRAR